MTFIFLSVDLAIHVGGSTCDATSSIPSARLNAGYKPPLIPVKLSIDSNGEIGIQAEASVVTPIGTFSIGGDYSLISSSIGNDLKKVLFLDELAEFNRRSLEVLRQPLEEGRVTISRALNSTTFPASFILVASMNLCPCGFMGDPKHACKCSPVQIEKYMGRISGPLLVRIDLHIEVPAVPFQELSAKQDGTSSNSMRESVFKARAIQLKRFGQNGPGMNVGMTSRQIRTHCLLDAESQKMLKTAMEELGLSARAHDRILRMARTIADLEAAAEIKQDHLSEAIGYRSLDRRLWAR